MLQHAHRALEADGQLSIEVHEVPPTVHCAKSAARRALWSTLAGAVRLAIAAESGQLRGHLVTSNVIAHVGK